MHNITFVRSYRRKGKRNINEIQHIDNVVIECITLEYSDPTSEAAGTLLYLWILGDDKYINHNIYWMHNIVLSDATHEAATLLRFEFSEMIWDAFKSLF